MRRPGYDVVVVGLGLAGLVAGLQAARRGARTMVVGQGFGGLRQRHGCLDVLGYAADRPVDSPRAAMADLLASQPEHPYAAAGSGLQPGLDLVRAAAEAAGLELRGSLESNRLVATGLGTLRPTCLAPPTMDAGWGEASLLAVGLPPFRDAWPELIAASLPRAAATRGLQVTARALRLEMPGLRRRHLDGPGLARCFDDPSFRSELAGALRPALEGADLVAFPAVLGLEGAGAAEDLAARLGRPVLELPCLPPSVPGLRLERALAAALRRAGGHLVVGPRARVRLAEGRADQVELESAGHPWRVSAARVVVASGGFRGGGLAAAADGRVVETVAGLPVSREAAGELVGGRFLQPGGHPMAACGVRVDARLRPVDGSGALVADGLFVAGDLLAGARRPQELSADGIACASGWLAAEAAAA